MEYGKIITDVRQYQDELLDLKENFYDPILEFWNGEQKKIYDNILTFKNENQANLEYVEAPEITILKETLDHPTPYKGSVIKDAKEAMDSLTERIKLAIETERSSLVESVKQKINDLKESSEYEEATAEAKKSALKTFEDILDRTRNQRFIGNMKVEQSRLSEMYTEQLNFLIKNKIRKEGEKEGGVSEPPIIRYTTLRNVERQVKVSKSQLESMSDVDNYLKKLRQALEEKINDNYKITLE